MSGGGGIYIGNVNTINISSCSLSSNTASGSEGKGGGILFACDNQDANFSCNTLFLDNKFSENTAEIEGGGIATLIASISDVTGCNFTNNTSGYGGDVAKTLTTIVANHPLENANSTHLGDITITVASGQTMTDTIYIYLQDEDGTLIQSDSSSTILLTVQANSTATMTGNHITAKNGNFSFDELVVTATPQTLIGIYIYIYIHIYIYIVLNGVFSIKNVQSQILETLPSTLTLYVNLRKCEKGEVILNTE